MVQRGKFGVWGSYRILTNVTNKIKVVLGEQERYEIILNRACGRGEWNRAKL